MSSFDLSEVEAQDRNTVPTSSIKAYGSDADTLGEVVFLIEDNSSFQDGQHVARVSIPREVALEFCTTIERECAK